MHLLRNRRRTIDGGGSDLPQVSPLPSRLLAVLRLLFRAGLFTTSLFCASLLADTLPYDLKIKPTGDKAMDQALLDASLLASLREEAKAGAFALVARANDDLPRLDDVLRSFGYGWPPLGDAGPGGSAGRAVGGGHAG